TAIQAGSIARIAATGSEAEASEASPAEISEPSPISSTSGMPAPAAALSTSDPDRTVTGWYRDMSAPELAQPMPVPAAITPTPTTTALTGPAGAAATASQSTLATRNAATAMFSAPNPQVAHFCTVTRTLWPSPETSRVRPTKTVMATRVSTGCSLAPPSVPSTMPKRLSRANAAVVVLTVSQPSRDSSETTVGPALPRTP